MPHLAITLIQKPGELVSEFFDNCELYITVSPSLELHKEKLLSQILDFRMRFLTTTPSHPLKLILYSQGHPDSPAYRLQCAPN